MQLAGAAITRPSKGFCKPPSSRNKGTRHYLSGDPIASNDPIGSTNVQWGERKLTSSQCRVVASARACPMCRSPPLNEVSLYNL